VNPGGAIGVGGEHFGPSDLGREQEVEIRGGGGGEVSDKAEGGFGLRAASHVGAEEGGGLALLLFYTMGCGCRWGSCRRSLAATAVCK